MKSNVPFPHWIVDDAMPGDLVRVVSADVPPPNWPHWVHYDNDHERKRTCRDIHRLSGDTCRLLFWLNSSEWIRKLEDLSGIADLYPDPMLHGGGLHCCDRGGFLGVHLDYALHPQLHLQRRLNVVLFLNRQWDETWGGALEFWDDNAESRVKSIFPRFNRVVIWEPSDIAYHGHPTPLDCPPEVYRKTIAVYYLGKPQDEHVVRRRALFVPRR